MGQVTFTFVVAVALLLFGISTFGLAQSSLPRVQQETPSSSPAPQGQTKKTTAKVRSAAGTVKSVDAANLVIHVSGKSPKEYTFSLEGAVIKVAGKEGTSTELKEGDSVRVTYVLSDSKMVAKTVITTKVPLAKAKEK